MNSAARSTLVAVAIIVAAGAARAQSVGPDTAGTVVNATGIGTIPWTSPNQAQGTSDGVFSFAGVGVGADSNYLKATNFGFALDPAAIILGIEVSIQKQTGGGTLHDNAVRIVKGGAIGATDRSNGSAWLPATPPPTLYGSPTDLWGESWTAADINASNFGAAIAAKDSVSGALAQIDSFAITVFYALCGDSIITSPTEDCDDGNTTNGDCCSSTCQFETGGCSDGDACTVGDTCDGAGTCDPGSPLVCDDGNICTQDSCNSGSGCVFTPGPRGTCRTAQKGLLLLKKNTTDTSKDKLVWKWTKGQATTIPEFGMPTGTTAYTLCVYAGTAEALAVNVAGGSSWTSFSKGYKYKDPSGTSDGVQKGQLKSGGANKAKAQLKGKGANLPYGSLTLPLATPVTAQLVNNDNSICYTTPLATIKKNDTTKFKAKQ